MKLIAFSLLLICSTLPASADQSQLNSNITSVPFKSCVGRGSNEASEYANQKVTVQFNRNSIQIIDSSGKSKAYFSAKKICGVSLADMEVQCESQTDKVSDDGSNYTYEKKCNAPMPGVPNRFIFYRVDLNFVLNLREVDGKKTGFGFLSCVVNDDGFHGLELSDCK